MASSGQKEPPSRQRIALGVIPARWGATRFPGKPLALLSGRPLVYHVWRRASETRTLKRVVVATDDPRIVKAVEGFGGEAVITPELPSGTDRVAWIARKTRHRVVVNIQADEPALSPHLIDRAVRMVLAKNGPPIATAATTAISERDFRKPDVVKVVLDSRNRALYFSRSPIPFGTDGSEGVAPLCHIGLYVFRRSALLRYSRIGPTVLERQERLEQLRALEHGMSIGVVVTDDPAVSINRPTDVRTAVKILREGGYL
jgi:3-deoxy-manno-octulosonate cytidylyltransferase (CMP-KDO synthetase)